LEANRARLLQLVNRRDGFVIVKRRADELGSERETLIAEADRK
jgi:hypothetical protein